MLKPNTSVVSGNVVADEISSRLESVEQFPALVPLGRVIVDPLSWLEAQPFDEKLVWSDREQPGIVAGAGAAACVQVKPDSTPSITVDACRSQIADSTALKFYGGFSFNGQSGWKDFGAGRFVAPRFLLSDDQLNLTVMGRADIARALNDLQRLRWPTHAVWPDLPNPNATRLAPSQDGWLSIVDEALTLIRSEVLEKIVLARKTELEFESDVSPWNIAGRLHEATYDCYLFGFQFQEHLAFLGATPERLFRRDGDRLHSEVVAGTRPRGLSSGEDQRLAYELLTSEKDQLEHDIVRKSIRQKLHKLVEHLTVDSHASVLRLAHKQHLCSTVEGKLKSGVDEGALLDRLHPTPAVGGYPTENALPEIARLEPFDRGWYAAPVGWIGADSAEFVVGIRSGLIDKNRLSLYSGAGIVKGSDPNSEWSEVDNKTRDFIDLFARSSALTDAAR